MKARLRIWHKGQQVAEIVVLGTFTVAKTSEQTEIEMEA